MFLSKLNPQTSVSFVLASGSPARAAILRSMQWSFIVDPADIDEDSYQANSVEQLTRLLALEKAKVVAERHPEKLVLTADTLIVDFSGEKEAILGKPDSEQHAKDMLQSLSGKTHKVITGLCLYNPQAKNDSQFLVENEISLVTFRELTQSDIEQYVATGEPMGKSGAYGIQSKARAFVEKLEGNEDNVIGLPVTLLMKLINTAGYQVVAPH